MKLRDIIGRMNILGARRRTMRDFRTLVLGGVAVSRGGAGEMRAWADGISQTARRVDQILDGWLEPEDIAQGAGGVFDVCDLRVWIDQAEKAGIAHVPVRPILSVPVEDIEPLLPRFQIPEPARRRIMEAMERDGVLVGADPEDGDPAQGGGAATPARAPEEILEAMTSAMEEIPASWMVRSHIAGGFEPEGSGRFRADAKGR